MMLAAHLRAACRTSPCFHLGCRELRTIHVTQTSGSLENTNDEGDSAATKVLVDGLVRHTKSLMREADCHLVAFSGGVDSSLVLALLKECSFTSASVVPVLGISPAVPREQIDLARNISSHLGLELEEVRTAEGTDNVYIKNEGQACLACKTHLYQTLEMVFDHTNRLNQTAESSRRRRNLYNGTNADDTLDPTRLGLIAAQNFRVLSPLQYTTKQNVRRAAKYLGLPNWNYAASPCLRSRLALGVEATQRHLEMIERAEIVVKTTLEGYGETSNLRVRMLTRQRARVEVDSNLVENANRLVDVWTPTFRELGFSSISVKAFKSGSVSRKLTEDDNHGGEMKSQFVEIKT